MHLRRVLTGLAFLPVFLLGIFWEGGAWFAAAVIYILYLGARLELYSLYQVVPSWWLSGFQNVLALGVFYSAVSHNWMLLWIVLGLMLASSGWFSLLRSIRGCRFEIAAHALMLLYILLPTASLVYLRSIEHGSSYLFYVLAVSCFTDIGAFYGGKLFGKTPLAPTLSPNKTWEGAVIGTVSSLGFVLISACVHSWWRQDTYWFSDPYQILPLIPLTIIMSIFGQVGDLFESALKRDLGVKDSGDTHTGHGGYLDMMDAVLWIAPAMTVYVMVMG